MTIGVDLVDEKYRVKRYRVQYPVSEYTFPCEVTIRNVDFDDEHMHVELTDGRIMSVPLRWIPTVYNASPEERAKVELNRSRTMIVWDPEKCAINDEIRITDYFGEAPGRDIFLASRAGCVSLSCGFDSLTYDLPTPDNAFGAAVILAEDLENYRQKAG